MLFKMICNKNYIVSKLIENRVQCVRVYTIHTIIYVYTINKVDGNVLKIELVILARVQTPCGLTV